ncbi:hydroxyacid dehydrogenase [candidate division KSB1 bacterium]|nr:hydroxyacid dehydrogenase [candidate division KSB1 bacterium]
MKILIADNFDPSLPDKLGRYGQVSTDMEMIDQADIIIIRDKTLCNQQLLEQAPNLKLIICGSVRLNTIDIEFAHKKGIEVYGTPEASTIAVAEWTLALMLALSGHLIKAHETTRKGQWLNQELQRSELYGKKLGIIGMGRIGGYVAKLALPFGMNIIGYDIEIRHIPGVQLVSELESLLAISDYISLHLPYNSDTHHLVDKAFLSKVNNNCFLINTSHGGLVNEKDMAEALTHNRLAGFATDVFEKEPPVDSPLMNLDNVLLAPHIGVHTRENLKRIGDIIVQLIEKFIQKKTQLY